MTLAMWQQIPFGKPARLPSQDEADNFLAKVRSTPGACCGECGKPFTAARRIAGYIAHHHDMEGTLIESRFPLCRACMRAAARQGRVKGFDASRTAREAAQVAALALEPAGGEA